MNKYSTEILLNDIEIKELLKLCFRYKLSLEELLGVMVRDFIIDNLQEVFTYEY